MTSSKTTADQVREVEQSDETIGTSKEAPGGGESSPTKDNQEEDGSETFKGLDPHELTEDPIQGNNVT